MVVERERGWYGRVKGYLGWIGDTTASREYVLRDVLRK
jgi:hypothetical protein